MKWFNEKEFFRVKELIDNGKAHDVKQWYFEDFKNNATTTLLAYVYAENNKKSEKVILVLGDILFPNGKTSPLAYNDVISELYNNLTPTKWANIKNMILSNPFMKFELKDADVILAFFEDEELGKYLEKNPSTVSKYLKSTDKQKINTKLLSSDNYELVKKALSSSLFAVENNSNKYGIRKGVWGTLWYNSQSIVNKEIRKRFVMEEVYLQPSLKIDDLYNKFLLTDYEENVLTIDDLITVARALKSSSLGNGGVAKLLAKIIEKDGKKSANEFIHQSISISIINILVMEINNRPFNNGVSLFGPELESEFIFNFTDSITDSSRLVQLVQGGSEKFVSELVSKFPELLNTIMERYPKKVPKNISDIFLF